MCEFIRNQEQDRVAQSVLNVPANQFTENARQILDRMTSAIQNNPGITVEIPNPFYQQPTNDFNWLIERIPIILFVLMFFALFWFRPQTKNKTKKVDNHNLDRNDRDDNRFSF